MSRLVVDRYEFFEELAAGGMAKVYLGRLHGGSGFTRTVAIKRMHAHLVSDPQFVAMFLDEARLASRIRHPNVVSTLDVVKHQGELLLVMDYVHGEALGKIVSHLDANDQRVPVPIAGAILSGILQGLHAAHEALDETGAPLNLVHRDVSPQNVLIGVDGIARLVDFGVAKASGRIQSATDGQVKGKPAYMAPERLAAGTVDRRTDIFAAAVIFWELLTGRRLFGGKTEMDSITKILARDIQSPKMFAPDLSPALEEVVMAGLDPTPSLRFATARDMDQALHRAMKVASSFDVAEWFQARLGPELALRAEVVTDAETSQPNFSATPYAKEHRESVDPDMSRLRTTSPRIAPIPPVDDDASEESTRIKAVPTTITQPRVVLPPPTRTRGPIIAGAIALTIAVGFSYYWTQKKVSASDEHHGQVSADTNATTSIPPASAVPVTTESSPAPLASAPIESASSVKATTAPKRAKHR